MAQSLNIVRTSCAIPIAIGIMVVGCFLIFTKRISEGCFIFLMVLGGTIWLVAEILPSFTELSIAQLNNSASQHNLLAEQEKTTQLRLQTTIKFLGAATPVIGFIFLILKKFMFGH